MSSSPLTDALCITPLMGNTVTEHKWERVQEFARRLERERGELIRALEILDDIGNVVLPLHQYRNAPDQTTVMGWDKVSLRLGHLRKARALLAKLKETT